MAPRPPAPHCDEDDCDVAARIAHWAQPGATASNTNDRREITKLCEVSKAFLSRQAARAVTGHSGGGPVVRFYTSDGTPMLVGRCWSRLLSCGHKVLRHARSAAEFLCERTHYLTVDEQGIPNSSVVVREPRKLSDKKMWSLFGCMVESSPTPRALGWQGPAINHHVWGRACASSLGRRRRIDGTSLDSLLNFCTFAADPLHDAHNALLWAMKPHMEEQTMKHLYLSVLSVRNSYDAIVENIVPWLGKVITFARPKLD